MPEHLLSSQLDNHLLQHNLDRAVYDESLKGSVEEQSRPRQSRNAVADACDHTNVGGAS